MATAQILVAGIHYVGLIGKDETPVTGAKSNTTKPRRESCKADKIVSLVCSLESPLLHFPPLVTTLFFNHSVFWGPTLLLEHLVLLLPCANTLLVNTVCHKSIYSFKFKRGGGEEALMMLLLAPCVLNNNTKRLSLFLKSIKLSTHCSWSS